MNKELVKKAIKIKILQYEVIKEILPKKIESKITSFQEEMITVVKEVSMDLLKEKIGEENMEKKTRKIGIS